MYAKINENGHLEVYTKRYVRERGRYIINPTAEVMLARGYKPLSHPPEPELERGQTLSLRYEDKGDRIECVYEVLEGLKK